MILLLSVALFGLLPQEPSTPFADGLLDELEERVPALLSEHGEPGLAVVIVERGAMAGFRGFGLADRETGRRVDADTLFNVGSISKTVTAWGVMDRIESGPSTLGTPVLDEIERWSLPASEHDAGGVTVERLLRHTAGLSMPSIEGVDLDQDLPTLEDELGRHVRAIAPPGTQFLYSGGGYLLLQLWIEEITERSFENVLRTTVLEPLGMQSTRFGYDPAMAERTATPYTIRVEEDDAAGGHVRWRQRAFVGVAGAGLYTSARDLGRFLAAHCAGPAGEPPGRGVLDPEILQAMWTPDAIAPNQGLGYEVPPPAGPYQVLMHGGVNLGWRAHFFVVPDLGLGIGVLTNSDRRESLHAVLGAFRDALLARIASEDDR